MSSPGRNPSGGDRVAVVDIGSNSIRLVVFDSLKRTVFPLFDEKVIRGLARALNETGKLRLKLPDDGSIPSGEVVEATEAKSGRILD